MDTSPVDFRTAASIEAAEARAWADMYAAAPRDWAASAGVRSLELGGVLVLQWAATQRRYFSRAIGLGVVAPVTGEAIDEILALWDEAGIGMFLLQSLPHCLPADYESLLSERGLEPFDAQDRVIRDGGPAGTFRAELEVERVTSGTAEEWSEFLQRVYRLDTGPWLPCLIGRRGWHQYVAREAGEIVAARGMFIGPDGTAWLGMDGPVPGLMTHDYEPDAALCAFMVEDGLAAGALRFITDIEVRSEAMDTPSYAYFSKLGFRRPYVRTHFARV